MKIINHFKNWFHKSEQLSDVPIKEEPRKLSDWEIMCSIDKRTMGPIINSIGLI